MLKHLELGRWTMERWGDGFTGEYARSVLLGFPFHLFQEFEDFLGPPNLPEAANTAGSRDFPAGWLEGKFLFSLILPRRAALGADKLVPECGLFEGFAGDHDCPPKRRTTDAAASTIAKAAKSRLAQFPFGFGGR